MHSLQKGRLLRVVELPSDGLLGAGAPSLISIGSSGHIALFCEVRGDVLYLQIDDV